MTPVHLFTIPVLQLRVEGLDDGAYVRAFEMVRQK